MLFVDKPRKAEMINFLKSGKVTSFTMQIDNTHDQYDADKGIVPAGALYKDKAGTVVGIVYNDAYVKDAPQPIAVIVEGHILNKRLPKEASEEEIAALSARGLLFYDENQMPIVKDVTV